MSNTSGNGRMISIVIPCYQEEGFISSCLRSVRAFVVPAGWEIEVLVVDGGSTDGTRQLVRDVVAQDSRFRLLENPRRTQSSGLNIGIRTSHGEYILRLDAHSTYPPNYLSQCLETSERTGSDNVGGVAATRPAGTGYQAALTQALTTHRFGVGASFRTGAKEGPADTVPYGFFRRDAFERFGLFDERLARAQDYELNKRILARGGKVWLNPHIVVQYFQQPTVRSFLRKQFFLDAPYNAYMWYLAPYAFTPRHAVTAAFALGLIIGLPLALVSSSIATLVATALIAYGVLALTASVQQAIRYRQPRHIVFLPFGFAAYHLTHGVGVLAGLARIAVRASPTKRTDRRWAGDVEPSIAVVPLEKVLVSIIVPTYQEQDFIVSCLDSVKAFSLPSGVDIEVLVVDGGSTDRTRDLVHAVASSDRRIRLLENPRRIQASALNIGIRESRGDYILRLDAHSTYPSDYLDLCLQTARRTRCDNVGGVFVTRARGKGYAAALVQALTTHWFGVGISFRTTAKEGPADTVPYGFFPKETFARFGLFDERLSRAQDYEFNRRIASRGGRVWLNPNIIVEYSQQPSLGPFLRKQFFVDAPFNAYMWYLAPYTFTFRHAASAIFALGIIIGIPLSFVSHGIAMAVGVVLIAYASLAAFASIQQAIRYSRVRHLLFLPLSFLAYHMAHGIGVLAGGLRIVLGTQPTKKHEPPWRDAPSLQTAATR